MSMTLPTPGGDRDTWGEELNDWLLVAHQDDGRLKYTFNVVDYGAVGDGATIDNPAIQEAIDAAGAAGGGTVLIPAGEAGVYAMDLQPVPGSGSLAACLWLRSNVRILCEPGVVLKLADGVTLPSGRTTAHVITSPTPYPSNTVGVITDIVVENLTLDCNGDNNELLVAGAPRIVHGLVMNGVDGGVLINCTVKDLYGTGGGAGGETMFFECNSSRRVRYLACEVDGSGAVHTATGFSIDNSYDVSYDGCIAHDLAHGNGFTNWQAAGVRYVNCRAHSCAGTNYLTFLGSGYGFNAERSDDLLYANCQAGGRTPDLGSNSDLPWFVEHTLHSCIAGFIIQGCINVTGVGMQAHYNDGPGLQVSADTAVAPTINCDGVLIVGSDFRWNEQGTVANSPEDPQPVGVNEFGNVVISGQNQKRVSIAGRWRHGADDRMSVIGNAPFLEYIANDGQSGLLQNVLSHGTHAFRWNITGVTALELGGGIAPLLADSNVAGRAGDLTLAFNLIAQGVKPLVVSGAGVLTVADTDFRHAPANGTLAVAINTTDNTGRLMLRVNGVWVAVGSLAAGALHAPPPNVQKFTANGTWTKPVAPPGCAPYTTVSFKMLGGAGGGGSGRRGAAGGNRGGGGGGGGGAYSFGEIPIASLADTEPIVVGAGGPGGAARTTNTTDGAPGTAGGTTGIRSTGPTAVARVFGGGAGGGGTASAGSGGAAAGGSMASSAGGNGGAGSAAVAGGSTNNNAGVGGGGGGGITADTAAVGAAGGSSGGTGNAAGTAGAVNGSGGPGNPTTEVTIGGGSGGGGGGSSITGAAGAGEAGGVYGGGGGGGGASLNGGNSGAGGPGAGGVVEMITT